MWIFQPLQLYKLNKGPIIIFGGGNPIPHQQLLLQLFCTFFDMLVADCLALEISNPMCNTKINSILLMYQKISDSRISSNRFESWINYSIRINSSILKFRYYHDSVGRWIDTIVIRLGGESILSWFGWAVNRYYHESTGQKIDTLMIQKTKIKKIVFSQKTSMRSLSHCYEG